MFIQVDETIQEKLPNFTLILTVLDNVTITLSKYSLFRRYVEIIKKDIKKEVTVKRLRNHPIIRAYRDFYWHSLKIDPTKIRPYRKTSIPHRYKATKFRSATTTL